MAFIDTRKLDDGQRIEADVCVIGSGAAGLTLASQFFGSRTRVAILESGGRSLEPEIQALCRGESVGQSHAPLDACRLRFFGGTTNHWTAHVRPLDANDFEERAWVPHSGWPFGRSELAPYYARASVLLGLEEGAFELPPGKPAMESSMASVGVDTQIRHVIPLEDRQLGPVLSEAMERSANVDTYLYASVLRIVLNEARDHVTELEVGTLGGTRVRARAKRYVLAAGGIENPRILLLSSIGEKAEPSEQLVGGFFANHPESLGGVIQPTRAGFVQELQAGRANGGATALPLMRLSAEQQRKQALQNCWLEFRQGADPRQLVALARRQSVLPRRKQEKVRWRVKPASSVVRDHALALDGPPHAIGRAAEPIAVHLIAEPGPNPASRVRLGEERDAFGQRRVELDWRLSPRDSKSVSRTLAALGRALGATSLGRLRVLLPSRGLESVSTVGSHHHMGTTRIHRDPKHGVVDENCRVHGISNLFVAGSSVFPTYGTANPTYTILALAYRLADHLAAELRGQS